MAEFYDELRSHLIRVMRLISTPKMINCNFFIITMFFFLLILYVQFKINLVCINSLVLGQSNYLVSYTKQP